MANLLDKNDRAVRAHIFDAAKSGNAAISIYIRNDGSKRIVVDGDGNNIGLVDVDSLMGNENPKGSGNYDIKVMVRVKFPAATQPNQGDNDNRIALGELQEAVVDQLHLTNNKQDYHATAQAITEAGNALAVDPTDGADEAAAQQAADNADMTAYSCLAVTHTTLTGGKNTSNEQDLNFYELCNFTVNVAGFNGYWN